MGGRFGLIPMLKKSRDLTLGKGGEQLVREQLARVLASTTFQQVDRLRRFLSFVVGESLAGRGDELKEYVVGTQVFEKEGSFDPRADPVVRVQARRLRARLVRYYAEEGQADQIVIELPKGGYAPVFARREADAAPRRSLGTTIVSRNTVCVLAFADHSPSSDLAPFCKGLREEIIHHLASLANLRVFASDAAGTGIRPNGASRVWQGGRDHQRERPHGRRPDPCHDAVPRRRHWMLPLVHVSRRRESRDI